MARMGMGSRIFGLLLIILVLVFGGMFWLDFLGLVNAQGMFAPVLNPIMGMFGQKPAVAIDADDPVLLDEIRIRKQEEALDLKYQDYLAKVDEQTKQNQTIEQKLADLDDREKSQEEKEKSFNDLRKSYDDRDKILERISKDLTSMRPADAVKILNGYDDQMMIDVLRKTQAIADASGGVSLVSVWLSKLDPARAAEIQRKMTLKPMQQP